MISYDRNQTCCRGERVMVPIAVRAEVNDAGDELKVFFRRNRNGELKNANTICFRFEFARRKETLGGIPIAGPMQINAENRGYWQSRHVNAQSHWFADHGVHRPCDHQFIHFVQMTQPNPEHRRDAGKANQYECALTAGQHRIKRSQVSPASSTAPAAQAGFAQQTASATTANNYSFVNKTGVSSAGI
ncbi:MAG: hypothetical protein QM813_20370 [Verrucomicrobiota bacterium]